MSTSVAAEVPAATDVRVTPDLLVVALRDGRVLSVPLTWYPRLAAGTARERAAWQLIGPGIGIHWPHLDEDVSVQALLDGRGSLESVRSLRQWQRARQRLANKVLQPTSRASQTGRSKRSTRTARG